MKRTIEIDDTLEERVADVETEIEEHFNEYLAAHPDLKDFDDYYQDAGADALHEIADSNTPIYNDEIDGLYFLHGDELDEAYENAGFGDGKENNYKQVAIYCYLNEKANDKQREIQEKFEGEKIR